MAWSPAALLAAEAPPNPGTAFITGSDRGIGFALVQEFESRGWQVIATARDPTKATELNAFAKAHPRVSVEKLDVTDTVAIDALAMKLKDRPIDALVNNAGIAGTAEGPHGPGGRACHGAGHRAADAGAERQVLFALGEGSALVRAPA